MRDARLVATQMYTSTNHLSRVAIFGDTFTHSWFTSGIWGGKSKLTAAAFRHLSTTLRCSATWGGKEERPPKALPSRSRSILLATVLLAFAASAFAAPKKLAKDLQSVSTGDVDVIVQFKVPPTGDHFNKIQNLGGKLKHDLRGTLKGASFHVPASALQALEQMDEVAHVSLDHKLSATGAPRDFYITSENAPNPGPGHDGGGIGVAIIDSGISGNGDIPSGGPGSRVVYNQSFVPGDSSTSDAYGHGTHVAGIVAGNGHNSGGASAIYTFKGIAPNANLINLRVLSGQ